MRFLNILIVLIMCMAAHSALAEERLVKIRLVPERGMIAPGEEMWIGIEQSIAPGWHTYWKNPGDSGVPPRSSWQLPEGFSIGEIQWPAPHRLPYGGFINYGYSDEAVLLQKLKAPENLPDGPVKILATIDVLVCKEECIPESGVYELTLNGGAEEDNSTYIEKALAQVPRSVNWDAAHSARGDDFILDIKNAGEIGEGGTAEFYPVEWGVVENAAPVILERKDGRSVLTQKRGARPLDQAGTFESVLVLGEGDGRRAYTFTTRLTPEAGNSADAPAAQPANKGSLWKALVLALLGGIVLNLMPCVFPVLSIKALSLVEAVNKDRTRVRLHGFSYTAGIVLSFLALSALLIGLKSAGAQIGWGFQLQNPLVIGALVYLFVLIGLSLSGFFEISGRFAHFGSHFTRGEDYQHSFFTGVLATLVATPCTAPFMGAAIGYALVQSAGPALLIFAALGFGLALPYLALSFMPSLQKLLPRPGHWMETFRQALAFPMFASSAWLAWVLAEQAGGMAMLHILLGGLLLALALWASQQMALTKAGKILRVITFVVAVILALALLPWPHDKAENFGEAFSPRKLEEFVRSGEPVFVEMTADWCITCKFNHAVAIDVGSTRKVFEARGVKYMIGDWTNNDPVITEYLKSFGRSGVPLYVYYGPAAGGSRPEPVVLPQILTPGIVTGAIED